MKPKQPNQKTKTKKYSETLGQRESLPLDVKSLEICCWFFAVFACGVVFVFGVFGLGVYWFGFFGFILPRVSGKGLSWFCFFLFGFFGY